jgi:hypothetical protein
MKEFPCKISASQLSPVAQSPADTRVLLSPNLKPPEKILTPKKFRVLDLTFLTSVPNFSLKF